RPGHRGCRPAATGQSLTKQPDNVRIDPADPLIRAYWILIEKRAVWFPTPRPAFQRILRGIHY
ncbi:MAG TPA: hypothetical protein VFY80_06765, partial [Burkholderiales bacterium]|nr:hypothetical protein [Burkholderiales bacterium]